MRLIRWVAIATAVFIVRPVVADDSVAETVRPNLLLVTVDDMSCDSVGAFGCKLGGTTPTIDAFARTAMRFDHAHVQTGSCYPSRNVMWSGRYSHNTGVEGFYQVRDTRYPHLVDVMKAAGYFVAIRGKVSHSTPYQPYRWDEDLTVLDGEKQPLKDAASYYRSTRRGIEMASAAGKPFCLNINISDPHKPFFGLAKGGKPFDDPHVPTRVYSADEVPVPGFLFDHPEVRRELAHYYSSVRRADDCFAAVMRALDEAGDPDHTIVMFLSDHGMPLPFAKTAVWYHSTRTPLIIRVPGVTQPGSVDTRHLVSAVDFMPTLCELVSIDAEQIKQSIDDHDGRDFDGRSFASLLRGQTQTDRDFVYTFHNENSGRNRSPMRSVISRDHGYIFNPWSDGERVFKTATTGTATFRTMQRLADTDTEIKQRYELFVHRVPEEFYDYRADPDARVNLIDDSSMQDEIDRHRERMRRFMTDSDDPMRSVFSRRDDAEWVSNHIDQLQRVADARGRSKRTTAADPKLLRIEVPASARRGQTIRVTLKHRLKPSHGTQSCYVTLKRGSGERLQRKKVTVSGRGTIAVDFAIPSDPDLNSIRVAAFIGDDYDHHLSHQSSNPVTLGPVNADPTNAGPAKVDP